MPPATKLRLLAREAGARNGAAQQAHAPNRTPMGFSDRKS
jgi:hypothetical protein